MLSLELLEVINLPAFDISASMCITKYIIRRWLFCSEPEWDLVSDALSQSARQMTCTRKAHMHMKHTRHTNPGIQLHLLPATFSLLLC